MTLIRLLSMLCVLKGLRKPSRRGSKFILWIMIERFYDKQLVIVGPLVNVKVQWEKYKCKSTLTKMDKSDLLRCSLFVFPA